MKTRYSNLVRFLCGLGLAFTNIGFGQSTIQFSASFYSVAENAGTATLSVWRLSDTNTAVSVGSATADRTATAGLDYAATNGILTFLAGETNQTIVERILNDGLVDPYESFTVMLSNPTNAPLALRLLTDSPADTNVTVSWQSVAGVSCFLERSTNLWANPHCTPLATGIPGQPATTSFTDSNAAPLPPLFYRVGVSP